MKHNEIAQSDLLKVVPQVLEAAKRAGAEAAEASASSAQELSVTVRMGDIETLEYGRSQSLDVTVYFAQRKGSASASDFDSKVIEELVAAASRIAKYTGTDEHAGLADASDMASQLPALDLDHPWQVDTNEAVELAEQCEAAARAVPQIVNSEGASLSTRRSVYCYGNTHGFVSAYPGTRHSLSCIAVARQNGAMQRDGWFDTRRNPQRLQSPEAIGHRAAERAVKRLGARKIKSCKVPVVFVPETAASVLSHFFTAISGTALYQGRSFLQDTLKQKIFPSGLDIIEQPHLQQGLYSAPFDSDGVATRERFIVKDGRVQSYLLNSYSARRLGMKTTGNAGGARNILISSHEQAQKSFEALLKDLHQGLVITELIGMGVNGVTGDYSQGASGFWVAGGTIDYPVEEITIADNLRNMYKNISALASDLDERHNIRCGSMLIDGIAVAGT